MENKGKYRNMIVILVLLLLSVCTISSRAGELNPASAPGSTMKTLDEVEPRIPIDKGDLPLTINKSGSYYLTESVIFDKDVPAAIAVEADNVTIDLCGFTLRGTYDCDYGIYCGEYKCVKVCNGIVRTFKRGQVHLLGNYSTIKNITAGDGLTSLRVEYNAKIESCRVYYPDETGIKTASNSIVQGCIVVDSYKPNCQVGIDCDVSCNIINCNVRYVANKGISLAGHGSIVGCVVAESDNYGIWSGSGSRVSGCVVYSSPTGIRAEEKGLIESCVVDASTSYGIYCGYKTLITGNRVRGGFVGIGGLSNNTIIDNSINGSTTAIQFEIKNIIEHNAIIDASIGIDMVSSGNLYLLNRIDASTADFKNESDDTNGGDNKTF
jgi:hypothetical protein